MFDDRDAFAENIAAGLEPGERALLTGIAHDTNGHEDLGRQDRSLSFDLRSGRQWAPADDAVERFIGGTMLIGFPGCLAQRPADAAETSLVPTDHRLVVATSGGWSSGVSTGPLPA